ncbi:MAG TPA: acetyl-CoA carboxylase biotin carboxylase subunit [Ktedonobacterales bacterium]|jgi:3-methylcrotonyl-CoA carboxylase alpha subunit|nr:acetyl-CoA carboxylase biotin carboxylase subunit [Ktedonobacterales bacterium]
MFERVLIANRGEIAVRVIRACQELGVRAIAVYSDVDRDALHVRLADEAYCIGPAPARESYLNIEAILKVARAHGVQAIHPGYGFLSENAEFAVACAAAGVVFIGPSAEAIRTMGSKTAAKRAVEERGVPTVPGYLGGSSELRVFRREAERIGFPLMIKAAAGGGGKGMRAVTDPNEFAEALAAAQREALAAFGDDAVFLEKLIVRPRHIEFQVLADRYGHTIHLGERECSIQRRHQKVIEESPSVALTPELRAKMGEAAVRAAQAVGYVNAGTVEFLLDSSGAYYFLEMNTRLQVEHPVTESVMGVDLVRHQLAIAAGERLALQQEDIAPRGHAIEARLYAEDPANGYLPSTGRVLVFSPPEGPGVRVDAGVAAGDDVTMHYDPMLAKLIVSGEDRVAAIDRMGRALASFGVLGVATNIPLLAAIAADADFQAGKTDTSFLERHDFALAAPREAPARVVAAAALWESLSSMPTQSAGPYNPWTRGESASSGAERRLRYHTGARDVSVMVRAGQDGGYALHIDSAPYFDEGATMRAYLAGEAELALDTEGERSRYFLARRGREILVFDGGTVYTLAKPQPLSVETAVRHGESGGAAQALVAPMSGTLIKVNTREGDTFAERQTLAVLGAMKMEHGVVAPYAGRVTRVLHAAGDVVQGGETLIEIEPEGGS